MVAYETHKLNSARLGFKVLRLHPISYFYKKVPSLQSDLEILSAAINYSARQQKRGLVHKSLTNVWTRFAKDSKIVIKLVQRANAFTMVTGQAKARSQMGTMSGWNQVPSLEQSCYPWSNPQPAGTALSPPLFWHSHRAQGCITSTVQGHYRNAFVIYTVICSRLSSKSTKATSGCSNRRQRWTEYINKLLIFLFFWKRISYWLNSYNHHAVAFYAPNNVH